MSPLAESTVALTAAPPVAVRPRSRQSGWGGPAELAKDTLDALLPALLLIVLLPFLALVALAVRLTSCGPALYSQERVGKHGRTFRIWKFRTMTLGADDDLWPLLDDRDRARTPLFKVPADPRITPLGRFLRKYSIDELPQLFNVLIGDMSLVGPRPQRPQEVALYSPDQHARLAVRPGLTGLWQVNGRSDLPWHEAVEHDLRYVHEWSLLMDVRILLRTPGVVLTGRGAV